MSKSLAIEYAKKYNKLCVRIYQTKMTDNILENIKAVLTKI